MGGMPRAANLLWMAALAGCVAAGTPGTAPPERSPAFRDGEAALLLEDYADAEAAFTQAVAEAGGDRERAAEASYWVGICRRKRGDAAGARAALGAALGSRDAVVGARARIQLGDLAWESRDWPAARELYAAAWSNSTQLLKEERQHAGLRYGRAAIRAGDWSTGAAVLTRVPGPASRTLSRIAGDGQFACVLGPMERLTAEQLLVQVTDARGAAELWGNGADSRVIIRPFDDWAAAEAEAARWRAERVPADALP
jgi:tetratricopeptide (TPR) repeat protein